MFLFFSVLIVLALTNAILEESDIVLHALDDNVIVLLAIVVIVFLAVSWKKRSLDALRSQHNLIAGLFVVALAFQLFAFVQEINDPVDFGNEVPSLILLVLTLANRFV